MRLIVHPSLSLSLFTMPSPPLPSSSSFPSLCLDRWGVYVMMSSLLLNDIIQTPSSVHEKEKDLSVLKQNLIELTLQIGTWQRLYHIDDSEQTRLYQALTATMIDMNLLMIYQDMCRLHAQLSRYTTPRTFHPTLIRYGHPSRPHSS